MSALPSGSVLTEVEYLRRERAAETRSEFWNGRVVAMAGGSRPHAVITTNIAAVLHAALRDTPCTVFSPDMKVKTPTSPSFFYPDVSVGCGDPLVYDDAGDVLLNPLLIVEVLSASTESADRGFKWHQYRQIPSLRAYLLVDQYEPVVEAYWRGDDGQWRFDAAIGRDSEIALPPLNLRIALVEVYSKVSFIPRPAPVGSVPTKPGA